MTFTQAPCLSSAWHRWKLPILGLAILFAGFNVKPFLPRPFDTALFVGGALAGMTIAQIGMKRSMIEGFQRLLLLGLFLQCGTWMIVAPHMRKVPAFWAFELILLTGVVGSLVSKNVRRNVYGFALAMLWVLLIGAAIDELPKATLDTTVSIGMGVSVMSGITWIYAYWAKRGVLPPRLQDQSDRSWSWITENDPAALATKSSLEAAEAHERSNEVRTISS